MSAKYVALLRGIGLGDPNMHTTSTYLTVTFMKSRAIAPHHDIPFQSDDGLFRILSFHQKVRALCCVSDLNVGRTPDTMGWLEKNYGKDITTRTWKTVERIVARL